MEFSARQLLEVSTTHGLGKVGLSSCRFLYTTVSQPLCESSLWSYLVHISLAVAFRGVERTGVGARMAPEPSNTHTVGKALCSLLPYV